MKVWELNELTNQDEDDPVFIEDERKNHMATVGQPADFAFGHPTQPVNQPQQDAADNVESRIRLTGGLEVSHLAQNGAAEAEVQVAAGVWAEAASAAKAFDQALGSARGDQRFSKEGRALAIREAGAKAIEAAKKLTDESAAILADVEKRDASFEQVGFVQRPEDVSEAAWEARLADVRRQLEKLDPAEIASVYASVVAAHERSPSHGNAAVVAAFETMPPSLRDARDPNLGIVTKNFADFVDQEKIRASRMARGRAARPDAAAARDQAERKGRALAGASALLRREVLQLVPEINDAPIEVSR